MSNQKTNFIFGKKNYMAIAAGFVVVIIGFIMMSGGKADSPDEFHPEEIFSETRITYAPITVLIGFAIIGFGIMVKPTEEHLGEGIASAPGKDKNTTVLDD